jgi:hypothetical protein
MDMPQNLTENNRPEKTTPTENVNASPNGKIDMERGKVTDCPGDGEGDRNDTKEMDDINKDQ